ncbi:MAG: hypothetical protein ACK5TY_03005 [Verrucomicrobiota bacterium]
MAAGGDREGHSAGFHADDLAEGAAGIGGHPDPLLAGAPEAFEVLQEGLEGGKGMER